jgi:hypothetical protein
VVVVGFSAITIILLVVAVAEYAKVSELESDTEPALTVATVTIR